MYRKILYMRPLHRNFSTSHPRHREKLVILGTGWGSYSVLKNINKEMYDTIVVSPRNHFLFTPFLASTTVGTLEFRSIIEPVRNSAFRQEAHYHFAKALCVDTDRQVVRCVNIMDPDQGLYELAYDKLVIGVGARPNTFNVPGVKEHAYFLKDLGRLFPQTKAKVQVTLIEANNILPSFDDRLRQYAEKKIGQHEQFTLLKDSVEEVTSGGVLLRSGRFIPSGLVVWSAGVAPTDFVQQTSFSKNGIGQVRTDRNLRVVGLERVFAIGDCADIDGHSLPCTAQVAEREGKYLAGQLNGAECKPFVYKGVGMQAYIGGFKAVSDLAAFKDSGFSSWVLWRSAYLTQLGSWRLRMQVPLDWCKTFFFGRDTSRFD